MSLYDQRLLADANTDNYSTIVAFEEQEQHPTNIYMLDILLDKGDLENVELGRVYVEDDNLFELFGDNALRSEHTTTIKQLKHFESFYRDQYGDSAEDDFLELFETIKAQDLPDDTLVTITIE